MRANKKMICKLIRLVSVLFGNKPWAPIFLHHDKIIWFSTKEQKKTENQRLVKLLTPLLVIDPCWLKTAFIICIFFQQRSDSLYVIWSVSIFFRILLSFIAYFILCMGTFLMLRIAIDYSSFRTDIYFLRYKQEYLDISLWKAAFYVHVFSSIFALAAGLTQFSDYLLRTYRKIHRTIGKIYVFDILFINFPAGLIMAVYANGLLPTKIAFVILDCLWFYFTYRAVTAVKKGDIAAHKRFMIRSYALTFSAITLRSWKIILTYAFHPDPLTLYMIDAWMGFVPNLLLAEWLIYKSKRRHSNALSWYYKMPGIQCFRKLWWSWK